MATLRERAREKLVERKKLIEQNRATIEALPDSAAWPADKRAEYDARFADIDRLKSEADTLERQATAEDGAGDPGKPPKPEVDPSKRTGPQVIEREFRHGHIAGKRTYQIEGTPELREKQKRAFVGSLIHPRDRTTEERAVQMDSDVLGGNLVAPQEFVADVIQAVDNVLFFRGLATVSTLIGAHSVGRPSLDTDPDDADWTSELQTGNEDSAMRFGKRELTPHPLAKRIKLSRKLIRNASNAESLVRDRLAYKLAVPQESSFMTGDGAQKPLGVFTASADGISTGRDVSTGNLSTSMTFDGLKEAKWTLKQQYWNEAQWIFHRDGGKQIDKLKDGNGQYIWQPSVVVGQPDRVLNLPVNFSEYAPNTYTSGLYAGILGAFRHYWVVESLLMDVQTLFELYAATNQIGIIVRAELDGMPVLEEAFVRVKLG